MLLFSSVDAPEGNIGTYHYESTEGYTPHGLPINLTDFGVEVLDYGAQKAYWAGNSLLLRYEEKLICFYGETPVELLNSEACAAYMRKHFS